MPRGAAYVSPGQRARNERDSGDPDRNSDDDWQVETSPDSTAASTPDDGRRKNTRKMPTLPGTPAEDAVPFADDVPDEVLQKDLEDARRNQKDKGTLAGRKRVNTTQNQYGNAARKYWPAFLKAAKWDANEKIHFVDQHGNVRDGTFRQFFKWLGGLDGMTKSVFKNALAWAQDELNHQLTKSK